MKLQLTETIIVNDRHKHYASLDKLCFKVKNLYNSALYAVKQHYLKEKKYLSYYAVNKEFCGTDQFDYRELPYAQMSQQVLRQVDVLFRSFFAALKSPKMKGKKVRVPKYKDKTSGRYIATYTRQCINVKDGALTLKLDKEGNSVSFKTDKKDIQQVRIVPRGNHIQVEIVYSVECEAKPDNGRYAAIDLGLNNICAIASNAAQAVICSGKPLKHINQHYNKKRSKMQSSLPKGKHTSKRLQRLASKRNRKVKDNMHKLTHEIIKYLKSNRLNTLIVGKNDGWKNGVSLGKKNNQNFVCIPYNQLIQMLEYKCKLAGISFILVKESYTSKCSFFDNEEICKHDAYAGRRASRGMFITSKGVKVNADINGALNIMRLGCKKLNATLDASHILKPENARLVLSPVRLQVA